MVRLKPDPKKISLINIKRSQFHYGSIKTLQELVHRPAPDCLNSTMVRLKLLSGQVSIKILACLNSTMVRLKPQVAPGIARCPLSQFHYGSIKTEDEFPTIQELV